MSIEIEYFKSVGFFKVNSFCNKDEPNHFDVYRHKKSHTAIYHYVNINKFNIHSGIERITPKELISELKRVDKLNKRYDNIELDLSYGSYMNFKRSYIMEKIIKQ